MTVSSTGWRRRFGRTAELLGAGAATALVLVLTARRNGDPCQSRVIRSRK